MKKINVQDAIGMELCHDITAMRDGFKGAAFKRGHIITAEDIPNLLDLGKRTIFVWEEHADEIHEEDAALRMAAMAPVSGAHYTVPSEGKTLLIADRDGMFRVDSELLTKLNRIGDITIATLPDHHPIKKGARLASMRIVPLVTKKEQIETAEALCYGKKLLDLKPYVHQKAAVIITGSEVYSGRIHDKFAPVIRAKLSKYPCEIINTTVCDDDLSMISQTITRDLDAGATLLILSGGMSVDPDDLTPSAIRNTGADVITQGVPAQPGNMTMLAYLGDVAIIGVPGAAISLPTTILDVMLPQLFSGVKFTKEDCIRLGNGGLCQLCEVCHFPNCTFGRY